MNTLLESTPEKMDLLAARGCANSPRPIRILLVDDDLYVRELNAGALIRAGHQVDTVGDGASAWKILNQGNYDLLITDNRMPRVTGLELIKKLRSVDMTLPVIMASGTAPTEELERHPSLKLDATLPKPFTIAELLHTVDRVMAAAGHPVGSAQSFAVKAGDIPTTPGSDRAHQPHPAKTPPRILVVDDEQDARQLTVDVLASAGYAVEAVKDGAAGWNALQAGRYDLIVTDNKMPRMSGVEMIEKLRAARMTLPVVMVTGYLPGHEYIRRPWLKPDVILEKPFSNVDLLAAVKRLLNRENGPDVCPQASPLEQELA